MEPAPPKASVYFRSLGCPKNQVDTEVMLGALALGGYAIAERLEDAQAAVVNTCSFIESAREESVAAILDLVELREEGRLQALVVAGCLPQRYGQELVGELPEVDAFVGTGDFPRIVQILDHALEGGEPGLYVEPGRTHLYDEDEPRLLIGGGHSAYIKIAEGCDRACAFCAIPAIRGRFQSRPLESIVREAEMLTRGETRELNLICQDTASYGRDLYGRPRLHDLVTEIDRVEAADWIRLLYLYPSQISDELIDAIAGAERVLSYLDVPLQHASDPVLRAMRRGVSAQAQCDLVARLRQRLDGLVLRTTFLVGFPGETDGDFELLCEFVREMRFERAGVFCYSDEEGTAAFDYADKVPDALARERSAELTRIQSEIMTEILTSQVGDEERVLIDEAALGGGTGRLWSQAPEIDGLVHVRGSVEAGRFAQVRITGVRGADLEAELR